MNESKTLTLKKPLSVYQQAKLYKAIGLVPEKKEPPIENIKNIFKVQDKFQAQKIF